MSLGEKQPPRYDPVVHGDPLVFYRKHYPNVKKGKIVHFDEVLFKELKATKKIGQIESRYRDFSDLVGYWRKHHPNVPLHKMQSIDASLYLTARKQIQLGLISKADLPAGPNLPKYTHQFRDDLGAFVRAYFPGATRKQFMNEFPKLLRKIDARHLSPQIFKSGLKKS